MPPDPVVERDGAPVPPRPSGSADVTLRMEAEFGTFLSSSVIDEVIRKCRRDLDGVSATMMPELLERLARECLADRVREGGPGTRSAGTPDG